MYSALFVWQKTCFIPLVKFIRLIKILFFYQWSVPGELLDSFSKQEILLPPPQFYELSRLGTFDCIEQLANFAVQRNSTGSELWMPVTVQTTDGEVMLLPGI